jgi:glucosamine-6-phosphate deaminase
MTRSEEVRLLLNLTSDAVREKAGNQLVVVQNVDVLHQHFADSIAEEIIANNGTDSPTKLILPVGPVGQYPLLAQRVNTENISLANCWFFMMDEQCDENGIALPVDHPLGFRYTFEKEFTRHVAENLRIPSEQLVFPDQENLHTLKAKIAGLGGIDTCYGGIGIHGHVAFNEPAQNIRESDPRVVELNEFTRTINAVRSQVGGNLENFPRHGITLGMRQILGAKRIRLYCRNGIDLDWANTILRLAVLGAPGDDYPVTHIRDHDDYLVVTDEDTLKRPTIIL